MRPPHCAGEIAGDVAIARQRHRPSMRPPHCAGEIREELMVFVAARVEPSMRPPHCAGEIRTSWPARRACPSPFNEAPALRGGNRQRRAVARRRRRPFNEAPALRGGNRLRVHVRRRVSHMPSMRPPHCAGEITWQRRPRATGTGSFNEAPALRGGNLMGNGSGTSGTHILQ